MARERNKEPGTIKSLVITILVLTLIPLPFALYMAGVQWIVEDWTQVPKDFIVTYLCGLLSLLIPLIAIRVRSRESNRSHHTHQ